MFAGPEKYIIIFAVSTSASQSRGECVEFARGRYGCETHLGLVVLIILLFIALIMTNIIVSSIPIIKVALILEMTRHCR